VSVTFAFLAFRAIHKHRAPSGCQRVVWAASLASATVNFAYEYGHTHNVIAGLYLALLSVFGMVIFHEFLAQFEEGAEYVRRSKRPSWGLRWLTSPYSTACSAVAWKNFPPADGTPATVLSGLANLERVRVLKRNAVEVRVVERHTRNMAAARRMAELAAATANPDYVPTPEASAVESDRLAETVPGAVPMALGPPMPARPTSPRRAATVQSVAARVEDPGTDPRVVPTTATTVAQWALMWVQMCADGDLVRGPLNNDDYARRVYGSAVVSCATCAVRRSRVRWLAVRRNSASSCPPTTQPSSRTASTDTS
jgi:hypothetical protein